MAIQFCISSLLDGPGANPVSSRHGDTCSDGGFVAASGWHRRRAGAASRGYSLLRIPDKGAAPVSEPAPHFGGDRVREKVQGPQSLRSSVSPAKRYFIRF